MRYNVEKVKKGDNKMDITEVKKVNCGLDAKEMTFEEITVDFKTKFEEEVLDSYNVMMSKLYKTHTQYSSDEIRLMVLNILTSHITDRLAASFQANSRKIEKLRKIKEIVKE